MCACVCVCAVRKKVMFVQVFLFIQSEPIRNDVACCRKGSIHSTEIGFQGRTNKKASMLRTTVSHRDKSILYIIPHPQNKLFIISHHIYLSMAHNPEPEVCVCATQYGIHSTKLSPVWNFIIRIFEFFYILE